jgi:hypothetical protein
MPAALRKLQLCCPHTANFGKYKSGSARCAPSGGAFILISVLITIFAMCWNVADLRIIHCEISVFF